MVELVNDNRKIGIALTGFGCLFLLLGVVLFFDKGLLALGNVRRARCAARAASRPKRAPPRCGARARSQVLFLAGITLLIGLRKTMFFFVRRDKWRGTVCFLGGMVTVLVGWPVVGMLVEMVGILNLFA
jgi:hypothetical protein